MGTVELNFSLIIFSIELNSFSFKTSALDIRTISETSNCSSKSSSIDALWSILFNSSYWLVISLKSFIGEPLSIDSPLTMPITRSRYIDVLISGQLSACINGKGKASPLVSMIIASMSGLKFKSDFIEGIKSS